MGKRSPRLWCARSEHPGEAPDFPLFRHLDRMGGRGAETLTILAIGLVSPELLTALKIHYIRPGGSFYEKIHPATYLVFAAFMLLLSPWRGSDWRIGTYHFDCETFARALLRLRAFVFQCLVCSSGHLLPLSTLFCCRSF